MDNEKRKEPSYGAFLRGLKSFIPSDRIYTDELRRFAWGTDAGFYRMVPKIIVRSDNEEEVSKLLSLSAETGVPVTFRAAGTSLSGQSVSDSVLIVAGKHWEKYSVGEDTVTLEPGIIGARVNKILSRYGRRFGPDPASIGSCMVGGIVVNNASGMSCGTHANSDRLLESVRLVLTDGTILDTGSPESRRTFRKTHHEFISAIEKLRDEVQQDKALSDRILYKYSIKNVTGLNLLPFVRFTDPFDIIAHLIVGSEGTLAFMSQVTMKTLPISPYKACAMVYFESIGEAARAVVSLGKMNVTAAELLDKRSLASVKDKVYEAAGGDTTAVLTQVEAQTSAELQSSIKAITKALAPFKTIKPEGESEAVRFTSDPAESAAYWSIRSGIFPTVGGMRKEGTTCLIEDVAFHLENLPEATADLSALLDKFGYNDSCIYGHALEGNFHFIINQSFATDDEVRRYADMIKAVAELVVGKYDGSLKAEHGTGRNMAPFVRYEWGEKAYDIMRRVKEVFDPHYLLNPGVIFNDDPDCFIKNFKALPLLETSYPELNKCIECGFCEVNCVTCGYTLSSRTRIALRREITHLQVTGENPSLLQKLEKQYLEDGNRSCAGDGLCSTSCPMGINVADLTHELRQLRTPADSMGYKTGDFVARHFAGTKSAIRGVLTLADTGNAILGGKVMGAIGKGLHKGLGLPLWTPATPKAYKLRLGDTAGEKDSPLKVVYFPSCLNQTMGNAHGVKGQKPLAEEMVSLLKKAGYEVIFPEGRESLCCGTIWESKGMLDIADRKVHELEDALWKASEEGKWPVLCDQSPCLHRMRQKIKKMKLYEPAEFIWTFLKDRLEFRKSNETVAVHITCSMRLMGLGDKITGLAKLCASEVIVPEEVGCCGFAGDKGMTRPDINAYALRKLKDSVAGASEGFSNSRTCEIGLATNSGISYKSIVYLVNRQTKAKSVPDAAE